MYAPQERNCIQHHCYGGQGFLVTEERILVTEEVFLVMEGRVSCRRGQGLFFLFIALCRMQNPTGG